ncbi:unnamed protein product [Chironomus riparius]|uniref:Uncharacterized protein n=1 Tax=Chironomus riparius TaxID=315576 RepID=A0A9N9RWT7_9DIPT|nr:unnamed protein product [Chironomus riparius]
MHIKLSRFREFIEEIFDSSSIHGFPYVIRRDFHVLEKYEDNPTVLSVDIVSYGEFDRPSFTICTSNYNTTAVMGSIVKKFFGVEPGDERYNESVKFVEQIKATMYNTLNLLQPFNDMPGVNDLNLMDMAYDLFKDYPTAGIQFAKVMTERGMCQSSTTHFKWQLPIKSTSPFERVNGTIDRGDKCTSLEVCRISVTPNNLDVEAVNRIYINSYDEVMCGDDLDYVELAGSSIQERHVKIDDIIADPNIRHFKPKSRKCKFMDEHQQDGYYDLYTPNFCKMSCRIRRALRYCKCVPYFYPVRGVKFCNMTGLICLSKTEWYDASKCECMKLCETTILTKLSSKDQNLQFDRMLTIDLIFPKTRIKRSVLFDFDDLLVGLGGSLALFLGLSFLCSIELVYHIIEYCLEMIINCVKP